MAKKPREVDDRFDVTLDLVIRRVKKDGKPVLQDGPAYAEAHQSWGGLKDDGKQAIEAILVMASVELIKLGVEGLNLQGFPEMSAALTQMLEPGAGPRES